MASASRASLEVARETHRDVPHEAIDKTSTRRKIDALALIVWAGGAETCAGVLYPAADGVRRRLARADACIAAGTREGPLLALSAQVGECHGEEYCWAETLQQQPTNADRLTRSAGRE